MAFYSSRGCSKFQQEQLDSEFKKIANYFKNAEVSVTKEAYYEVCEQMGTEIVEDEIPVDIQDLAIQVQNAMAMFGMLPDRIGEMSGAYYGKDFNTLEMLYNFFDVDRRDWLLYLEIIQYCSARYGELIARKADKASNKVNVAKNKGK